MESQSNNYFRMITLKNGQSPSFLNNNLVKSDTYIAFVKNGFQRSMVQVYRTQDIENETLQQELIQAQSIEWDSKEKECTHVNYLFVNKKWYLLIGYVGELEIYNEDGSRRYFCSSNINQIPLN